MIPSPAVISKSMAVTTSAAVTCTLTHDNQTLWYVSGFEITPGAGITAGAPIVATLAGLLGGTISYVIALPTGATVPCAPLVVDFKTALAGVDAATDVVLTVPAAGAGSAGLAAVLHGYKGSRQLNA